MCGCADVPMNHVNSHIRTFAHPHMYFVKTPWLLKKLYPDCVWDIKSSEKNIYLTFDDGPHPVVTKFVLDELQKFNAKATFFCIGKNVVENQDTYKRILSEGHAVGNHTYDHLNGWKAGDNDYLKNVQDAEQVISSELFRPPYGRITRSQIKKLKAAPFNLKIIMWTALSGDFDRKISGQKCYSNVIRNTTPGSIIVFHDSEKASGRLRYALPLVLKHYSSEGYKFLVLSS